MQTSSASRLDARLSMKIRFSPNVFEAFSRVRRTVSTTLEWLEPVDLDLFAVDAVLRDETMNCSLRAMMSLISW